MSQKKYIRNQKLREARELRGWSQWDVAERLGPPVDKSTVSRWERGVVPRPYYRQKLAEIFQTNMQGLGFLKEAEVAQPSIAPPDQERPPRKPFYKIPRPSTPLLGREQEIEDISVRLLQQNVQLLTLLGSGGVGKTRVGIEIASQMRQHFSDGLCFVSFATVSDPDLVVSTLAKELEINESGKLPLIDQLKDFFSEKRFLLLLDNFEHVVITAPLLENLLDACPRLKVIVRRGLFYHFPSATPRSKAITSI